MLFRSRLQDIVRSKPDDWETQLALAKKLAEAAVVLAGEDGRAEHVKRIREVIRVQSDDNRFDR